MSLLARLLKALRPAPPKSPPPRVAGLFAPPYPAAGWWRDDPAEQLRNYHSWVYAAVNAIAQEVARQRPFLYRNTGQAEHEQEPLPHTHPLCPAARPPEPVADAVGTVVSHGRLSGTDRQLLLVRRAASRSATRGSACPANCGSCRRRGCASSPIATQFVKALRGRVPRACRPETFGPDEIIHLKYPNPLDPHYGLSPLQANALTVDANTELQKSRVPDVPRRPAAGHRAADRADADRADRARGWKRSCTAQFGGRENWHRPLVLEQGLKASPWTLTPAEMDYLNSSRMTRDEIFALFRVPAPIAGIVENMGLGADIWFGARVMFCEGTVQPKLDLIGQALTRDLGRRYGAGRGDQLPRLLAAQPGPAPRGRRARREDWACGRYNEIRRSRGLRAVRRSAIRSSRFCPAS